MGVSAADEALGCKRYTVGDTISKRVVEKGLDYALQKMVEMVWEYKMKVEGDLDCTLQTVVEKGLDYALQKMVMRWNYKGERERSCETEKVVQLVE